MPDGVFVHGNGLCESASVGSGTRVWAFAHVLPGAVVTRDVPAHAFVVGNPGRVIGWVCECGQRLPNDLTCSCGKSWTASDGALRRREVSQ